MKRRSIIVLLLILAPILAHAAALVDAVDPFIGTGGHGHTFPGPTLPFGMVQLSPDTRLTGWDGCSGYHYSDGVIYGFSHTHLSGTGASDYGDILFMPVTGTPHLDNGYPDHVDEGYGSRFQKSTEHAAPGYYAVHLQDYDVDVELTATPRTGLHRYVFPKGRHAYVLIDLTHRDSLLDADVKVIGNDTVEGFRRSTHWAADQVVYFRARFSRPFSEAHIYPDASGRNAKAVLSFGDHGGEVLAQVAISAVDLDGARKNLKAEWAGFDFGKTRKRARAAWNRELERFTVEGATKEERAAFATALYHSFIAPNLFSDIDGRYRGMDGAIHKAEGRNQYTVFSLWDTFRATHPLFTLVERARTTDFIRTFLAQYEQGGRLPVWELAANETDCMIGYHSVSVIADAYLKGIRGFDAEEALKAMVHSATLDIYGLDAYKRDGFIGSDEDGESVSKTLEYAYDDACIARMAAALGHDDTAAEFARRAQSWRNLFDPQTRFFRPRRNGQWLHPFDPLRVDFNYTEANAWQYRFAVPHDVPALIRAFGGDKAFEAALDSLFTVEGEKTGNDIPDITGLIGQYAHGNEPSHHVAWLSHFTGHPELTIARVTRIRDEFYTDAPDGLAGNEDCGQMSSWYVLAALGLYDVAPTSRQWLIIPPQFERMSVRFENGRTFTTRRVGTGDVHRVTWNGKPLERSYLRHDEVIGGGELVFYLGEAGDWGKAPDARPGTPPMVPPILPAPWADAASDRFRPSEGMGVRLASGVDGAAIRWTDRPDADPRTGTVYDGPIHIDATTTLRFVAIDGDRTSPVVTARFDALPHDWRVDVASTPNAQYTAGGPDALIDGRRGNENWRTGGWQGYQGEDFVATLDLGRPTRVTRAGAGFLQDARSWIWLPKGLVVEASADGHSFVTVGRVGHDVPADTDSVVTRDLTVALDGRPVRALRFHALSFGTIPDWHPGAGGQAFIFVDELVVETANH